MGCLDACFGTTQEEAFQSLVFEAPNHVNKCNLLRDTCQLDGTA